MLKKVVTAKDNNTSPFITTVIITTAFTTIIMSPYCHNSIYQGTWGSIVGNELCLGLFNRILRTVGRFSTLWYFVDEESTQFWSFMRSTKSLRHQPEKGGIYLDDINLEEMKPEVAALYFPKT